MTDQPRLPMSDTVTPALQQVEHVYAVAGTDPLLAPGEGIPDRLRTFTPAAVRVIATAAGDTIVTALGRNARGETVHVAYSNGRVAANPLERAPEWVRQLATRTRTALLDAR